MCLTFHLGLSSRLFGVDSEVDEVGQILMRASRRMDSAVDALDDAREVDDFQAAPQTSGRPDPGTAARSAEPSQLSEAVQD